MLYIKIFVALFLSALPFIFKHLILPKKESSAACRNIFTAMWSAKPFLTKTRHRLFKISIRIYNALKQSLEARKFFALILFLVLLTVVMIDFNASASVARIVNKSAQESAYQTEKLIALYNEYKPYITFRYATLLAGVMVIPFFSFKVTDRILVWLQGKREFLMTAITTLLFVLYSAFFSTGRNLVIVQLLYIILGASILYPSIRHNHSRAAAKAVSKDVINRLYRQRHITC